MPEHEALLTLTSVALDEAVMAGLAETMASLVEPPLVVYLEGDLGAGKTTYTRAFVRKLGHRGSVKSPTYGLMEDYPLGRLHVVHLDLYRIEQSGELEFLGLDDLSDGESVFMIEWPDRGDAWLPVADLIIRFRHHNEQRILEFEARNRPAETLLQQLAAHFPSGF